MRAEILESMINWHFCWSGLPMLRCPTGHCWARAFNRQERAICLFHSLIWPLMISSYNSKVSGTYWPALASRKNMESRITVGLKPSLCSSRFLSLYVPNDNETIVVALQGIRMNDITCQVKSLNTSDEDWPRVTRKLVHHARVEGFQVQGVVRIGDGHHAGPALGVGDFDAIRCGVLQL